VRYLLPAIPNVLYGGLGRPQVERLAALRRTAELAWQRYVNEPAPAVDYETLFQEVLAGFDALPEAFSVERVQDALIGQMARALGVDYNTLEFTLDDIEQYQRALMRPPRLKDERVPAVDPLEALLSKVPEEDMLSEREGEDDSLPSSGAPAVKAMAGGSAADGSENDLSVATVETVLDSTSIQDSPPPFPTGDPVGAERLQTIQQRVAEHLDDLQQDDAPRALPLRADGLFPVTDVWHVEPGLDAPEPLRLHVAQFAREIAGEAGRADCVEAVNIGIGFVCALPSPDGALSGRGRGVLSLLRALSRNDEADAPEFLHLDETLGLLLRGRLVQGSDPAPDPDPDSPRLSDGSLIKLFRLLRLARRLLDLESGADASGR
jgi:hypothetical protein